MVLGIAASKGLAHIGNNSPIAVVAMIIVEVMENTLAIPIIISVISITMKILWLIPRLRGVAVVHERATVQLFQSLVAAFAENICTSASSRASK
jgi:hypothetical protein